jgi:hypothetical protein
MAPVGDDDRTPAPGSGEHQKPMSQGNSRFLTGYLLIATVVTIYLVYSLWSAQPCPPEAGTPPAPDCPAGAPAANPELRSLHPKSAYVGSAGSDAVIIGCGLTQATQVKVNGALHPALFLNPNHIRVTLTPTDLAAAGTLVFTLSSGAADFGLGIMTVLPPNVCWQFPGFTPWPISQEMQLLLLVLFTGAFGSCVYALKSLADYKGESKLYRTWFTFYLIQPFEGAGSALLLYLVIRGGFMAGTGADVKSVNQFGMCAIAGLAGAFSDVAFMKLREVFLTLFKPHDDRSGKLGPKITTASLPDGTVGVPYKQSLQATDGTLPLKWSVTPTLPPGLTLDPVSGTLAGTPTAVAPKVSYKFTVTDSGTPALSTSVDLTLEIKPAPPKITTTALSYGASGAHYSQTLQSSGGTAPLTWSVAPALPAGLTLDAAAGTIAGTPTAASPKATYKFTVKDSATPAASSTVDLTLEIR